MARSRKPLVAQKEVLARTLARQSKSQIAREMDIDRETVTRIQECHNMPQLLADSRRFIVEKVMPDAIRSLHAQIIDRDAPGDGDLAARLLERSGVLDGGSAPTYNIEGDVVLQQGLTLPPSRRAANDVLRALTVEAEIVGQPALTPARAAMVDQDAGAALPAAETVQRQSAAAPADGLIRARQAAIDRECEERTRAAHAEQRNLQQRLHTHATRRESSRRAARNVPCD
jgi:hypothetical protein